ncbi:hypothetical protein [Sphingomonas sp. 35-24ZXX]|uniref:hypothetical protein n=1 Tax=Sphingomonas sp. 35-24ZXX TaxID=1545915 RepID=UPI00053BF367|nr:hypothetical protein [Sphingomonas sp. 35-24ZXX]
MNDDTTKHTAHLPATTTNLFRINHRLGTLFAFARSQDGAAAMFVAQWASLLGNAPGDFSIDRMVRFKRAGRFMQSTQAMQGEGREGLATFSDDTGWTMLPRVELHA